MFGSPPRWKWQMNTKLLNGDCPFGLGDWMSCKLPRKDNLFQAYKRFPSPVISYIHSWFGFAMSWALLSCCSSGARYPLHSHALDEILKAKVLSIHMQLKLVFECMHASTISKYVWMC